MSRKVIYFLLFLAAAGLRLAILFRQELIPGVNGGYYPLQVRSLLENGRLGFADMPLYFWFNAFWVKAIALFYSAPEESWIIPVVKTVDAFFLPLLLIPLYFIAKEFRRPKQPGLWWEAAVATFAVAAPWPLMFTGDLQKNAFAIPFFFAFLLFGLKYLRRPSRPLFLGGILCVLLAGLAHFGVFVIAVATLGLGLFVAILRPGKSDSSESGVRKAPKWAALALLSLALLSTGLVALFDSARAWRLLTVAGEIFRHPALFGALGPPELLGYFFSWLLAGLGAYALYQHKTQLDISERVSITTLTVLILLLSFPLLNADYAQRLMLMLFVPQSVLCLLLFRLLPPSWSNILATALLILCLAFSPGVLHFKQPVLSQAAYDELEGLKSQLPLDENTLAIARHGLEWWAGWALHCKTGNEKGVNAETPEQYRQVFFLHQKKGKEERGPAGKHPGFPEPEPPFGELLKTRELEYFQVYRWQTTQGEGY